MQVRLKIIRQSLCPIDSNVVNFPLTNQSNEREFVTWLLSHILKRIDMESSAAHPAGSQTEPNTLSNS